MVTYLGYVLKSVVAPPREVKVQISYTLAHHVTVNISPAPSKLGFSIVIEGREHKFWDLDAQIAQIKHKISSRQLTLISTLGVQWKWAYQCLRTEKGYMLQYNLNRTCHPAKDIIYLMFYNIKTLGKNVPHLSLLPEPNYECRKIEENVKEKKKWRRNRGKLVIKVEIYLFHSFPVDAYFWKHDTISNVYGRKISYRETIFRNV